MTTNATQQTTKLDEARKRWGTVQVHTATPPALRPSGVAATFTVGRPRISRVTEQVRDVSAYRLER